MHPLPLALALALAATAAGGETWLPLDGPAAEAALAGRTIVWEGGAVQHLRSDGETSYAADPASPVRAWGRWAIRGERYCTAWPPAESWRCYRIEAAPGTPRLRFTADDGARLTAGYAEAP
jgi:hypothetical protein